jgi:hypothetical protein
MAELIHNYGIELPIYPTKAVVATSNEAIEAAASDPDASSFLRRVRLHCPGARNLGTALRISETAMRALAQTTGADIPQSPLGLYRLPPEKRYYNTPLAPKGYLLVADVEIIRPLSPMTVQERTALAYKLDDHSWRPREAGEYSIRDTGPSQSAMAS